MLAAVWMHGRALPCEEVRRGGQGVEMVCTFARIHM
jgi:hypothetical protein